MDVIKIGQIRHLVALEEPNAAVLVPVADLRELLDLASAALAAREVLSEREWNYSRTNRRVREAMGVPDPFTFSSGLISSGS